MTLSQPPVYRTLASALKARAVTKEVVPPASTRSNGSLSPGAAGGASARAGTPAPSRKPNARVHHRSGSAAGRARETGRAGQPLRERLGSGGRAGRGRRPGAVSAPPGRPLAPRGLALPDQGGPQRPLAPRPARRPRLLPR